MVRTRRPVHILIRAGATSLTPDCVLRQAALDKEVLGYRGIMTVGVWPGEDPGDVWDTDDKLSTRNAIWVAERTTLEAHGFTVVKTTANPRHFTVALPDTTNATIDLLRSLMEPRSR